MVVYEGVVVGWNGDIGLDEGYSSVMVTQKVNPGDKEEGWMDYKVTHSTVKWVFD